MDDILKLAKDYSKKRHLDLLPRGNNNILENLDFIYDENWENQGVPYPYEILTYLFDSYYVLPERPDLAALFCWQAINHSYYVQQLSDNNVGFCQDTKGVELVRDAIGYSCAGVPLFRRNRYRQSSGRKPLFRNRDTALN